ncbi:MAG TPA: amino acid adenylation domain-containing protein [Bacteroidia bacterium]|nr:amino acid adenylation domain-containing protein [Bacteroidia bacterium]
MLTQLKESLTQNHHRNAFWIENNYYSYARLDVRSSAVAAWLAQHNPHRRPVGIIAADTFDTYSAILGIMFSGAAYVPILPSYPKDRSQSIIEQAGMEIILSPLPDTELEGCINPGNHVVLINSIPENNSFAQPEVSLKENAYILFTSGSTGVPKGVPLTHGNLWAFMDSFFSLGYEITAEDRFLQMFDLTFDLSVMSYLAPLFKGACVYTVPADGIKYMNIYSLLEEHELTFTLMVPSILSYLRPYFSDIDLPKLRHSLFCGEALYADVAKEWQVCVPNALIQNVYGPTEATIFCMTYDCRDAIKEYNGMVCIGQPMKNVAVVAVDENNRPVKQGDKGELCLSGGQVTSGYINNLQKNKEAFFELNGTRYYRTGDIAFMDAAGDYQYCGRVDYQVKVKGGFRVELNEIEAHARNYTGLANVAAVAIPNNIGISQIFLFLENYTGDIADITRYLKTQVPEYMLPEEILNIPVFPLNNNGKTDRKALGGMVKVGMV